MMPTPDDRPQCDARLSITDVHAGVCVDQGLYGFSSDEVGRIFSIGGPFPSRTASTTIGPFSDSALSHRSNDLKFQS